MLDVSNEVLQDSIIALESQIFEEERNNRLHGVADIGSKNLRVMLGILRNELFSREL